MQAEEIITTHPDVDGKVNKALIEAINAAAACALACAVCADACVAEPAVADLRQCIRLNLDCADVCVATTAIAARRTGSNETLLIQMLQACMAACRLCAEECERHVRHEHCRICAGSCRRCEVACQNAASTIA
jgi:hypothetical protein